MDTVWANKLKIARENKRLSQDRLASLLSISRSAIQSYERGRTRPKIGILRQLIDILECSDLLPLDMEEDKIEIPKFLHPARQTISPISGRTTQTVAKLAQDEDGEYVSVPLVRAQPSAGGGTSLEPYDDQIVDYMAFRRDWLLRLGLPKNLKLMEVKGDSMEPIICDSDMVLLDFSRAELRPGKIFAVAFDGHIYLKRLYAEPGRLILRSENKVHSDVVVDLKDSSQADTVQIIAQAIWWCHSEKVDSSHPFPSN